MLINLVGKLRNTHTHVINYKYILSFTTIHAFIDRYNLKIMNVNFILNFIDINNRNDVFRKGMDDLTQKYAYKKFVLYFSISKIIYFYFVYLKFIG